MEYRCMKYEIWDHGMEYGIWEHDNTKHGQLISTCIAHEPTWLTVHEMRHKLREHVPN